MNIAAWFYRGVIYVKQDEGRMHLKTNSLLFGKKSSPPAIPVAAFLFGFILLLSSPLTSWALTLAGQSNTFLSGRETADNSRIIPVYEYLDFSVDKIGDNRVSFHFGGWGKGDLGETSYGKRYDADLEYAYLSFKNTKNNTLLNLGRLLVFEGVAAERVDGVYLKTDLKGGFGVSGFVGSPVESDPKGVSGDTIYGGRASFQVPASLVMGISYLRETKSGSDFREEAGLDLFISPLKKVVLTGKTSYNGVTKGWMEHAYVLSLGPFRSLRLNTEASWINYKNYFTAATIDVFKLTPGILDPAEKVRVLGEEVAYSINEDLVASADYKNYDYNLAGNADYYGAKITYSVPGKGGAGFSFHRMNGGTDRLRYDEFRVYGFKKFGKADLTLDFLDVDYDSEVSGLKNSYVATLAAGYDLTKKFRVVGDVDYSRNPIFNKDIRTFLRMVCRFGSLYGGEKGEK